MRISQYRSGIPTFDAVTWAPRRIVTGHDRDGVSVFLADGAPPVLKELPERGVAFYEIWNTAATPAPIARVQPDPTSRPVQIAPPPGGTLIRINEFRPGYISDGIQSPMHRTETIDYGIVLEGEIYLVLEDSEVLLRPGDVVVQRGTDHAWANRSDAVARMVFVLVDGRFCDDLAATLGQEAMARARHDPEPGLRNGHAVPAAE